MVKLTLKLNITFLLQNVAYDVLRMYGIHTKTVIEN